MTNRTDGCELHVTVFASALSNAGQRADTCGVRISPVPTNLPEAIKSPADALAFIAVKKGLDAQKAAAVALLSLLDPNVGRNLNAAA